MTARLFGLLAWGLPPHVAAFVSHSPAFQVANGVSTDVAAVYPEDDVLLSGWLQGEPQLRNRAVVVDVSLGKGRVALLGFRVQHRGQSHGPFKLLFNAIYLPSGDRRGVRLVTAQPVTAKAGCR